MLCSDPMESSESEIESSEKDSQNANQRTEDQSKAEDNKTEQKSAQDFGHYWWCPAFGHFPGCQTLSYGYHDPNYWPQMMANSYQMPFYSMPANSDQSLNSNTRQRVNANVAKKSPKYVGNDMEIERLYSCRLCDDMQETKDVMSLRKHIEEHLGRERPFLCRVCGKRFNFRSNCRNHLIAHSVVRKHYKRVVVYHSNLI